MLELPPDLKKHLAIVVTGFAPLGITEAEIVRAMEERVPTSPGSDFGWDSVFARAYKEALPPLSAFIAGSNVPFGTYHVVDFLATSCQTVGEGIERLGRYLAVVRPDSTLSIADDGDLKRVTCVDGKLGNDWFFDEWTLGVTLRGFRASLGDAFKPVTTGFRRPAPADSDWVDQVRALTDSVVTFGENESYFTFTSEVWGLALPAHNSRMRETLEAHAAALLREATPRAPISSKVRASLSASLAGEPNIERVAKSLGMTARTLQRRLRDEGASFQSVLDGHRADLAQRYLSDEKLGIAEVAFLLGYGDASAFARAFRRWFGRPPAEFRRIETV